MHMIHIMRNTHQDNIGGSQYPNDFREFSGDYSNFSVKINSDKGGDIIHSTDNGDVVVASYSLECGSDHIFVDVDLIEVDDMVLNPFSDHPDKDLILVLLKKQGVITEKKPTIKYFIVKILDNHRTERIRVITLEYLATNTLGHQESFTLARVPVENMFISSSTILVDYDLINSYHVAIQTKTFLVDGDKHKYSNRIDVNLRNYPDSKGILWKHYTGRLDPVAYPGSVPADYCTLKNSILPKNHQTSLKQLSTYDADEGSAAPSVLSFETRLQLIKTACFDFGKMNLMFFSHTGYNWDEFKQESYAVEMFLYGQTTPERFGMVPDFMIRLETFKPNAGVLVYRAVKEFYKSLRTDLELQEIICNKFAKKLDLNHQSTLRGLQKYNAADLLTRGINVSTGLINFDQAASANWDHASIVLDLESILDNLLKHHLHSKVYPTVMGMSIPDSVKKNSLKTNLEKENSILKDNEKPFSHLSEIVPVIEIPHVFELDNILNKNLPFKDNEPAKETKDSHMIKSEKATTTSQTQSNADATGMNLVLPAEGSETNKSLNEKEQHKNVKSVSFLNDVNEENDQIDSIEKTKEQNIPHLLSFLEKDSDNTSKINVDHNVSGAARKKANDEVICWEDNQVREITCSQFNVGCLDSDFVVNPLQNMVMLRIFDRNEENDHLKEDAVEQGKKTTSNNKLILKDELPLPTVDIDEDIIWPVSFKLPFLREDSHLRKSNKGFYRSSFLTLKNIATTFAAFSTFRSPSSSPINILSLASPINIAQAVVDIPQNILSPVQSVDQDVLMATDKTVNAIANGVSQTQTNQEKKSYEKILEKTIDATNIAFSENNSVSPTLIGSLHAVSFI